MTGGVPVRILLLGAPGSGKGTQGERLAEHFGVRHISSGDLLRAAAAGDDERGAELRSYIDAGELVPDDIVLRIVAPVVAEAARAGGYVLDGFPRTRPQAEQARRLASEAGIEVQAAVFLDVPEDELVERLVRRKGAEGRSDDSIAVIRHRLQVFDEHNAQLLAFYSDQGLLVRVPAEDDIEAITRRILDELDRAGVARRPGEG